MSDRPGGPLPAGAPAEPDPMLGRLLAERYRIETLLARGGMARVYRGRDTRLERDVAVKVLSPPYSDNPDFTRRFLEEARAAASISHPSLVHVYDSGTDGRAHFIVMELLDAHRSLREEMDARGPLPRDEVLEVGQQLLAGLRAVHERGLVHCDVKPANIMRGPGPAKLIDFGIARSPAEPEEGYTTIGSLPFMSPEQLQGHSLSPASDLFSLAVVLYEALTGRLPYAGSTPEDLSAAQASGGVRPPSTIVEGVPARLDAALLQGLRPDPEQRFRSAEAMGRALGAAADEVGATRHDTTVVHRTVRPAARATGSGGYVPPIPEPPPPAPGPVHAAPAPGPRPAPRPVPAASPPRAGRGSVWGQLGTLAILVAAALVVILVVLPLMDVDLVPGAGGPQSPTPPAQAPPPGIVIVPQTIGLSAEEAMQVAGDAGLNWTLHCDHDESLGEGIIEQEPPAGTEVRIGSAFAMYSARIGDCEDGGDD